MTGVEVLAAAAVASAAVSAAGAISSGQAQSKMASYNAAVAERDAQAARQQAAFEESRQRQARDALLGKQRAAFAASGVTPEGSPLLVAAETATQAEIDAEAIRYSGSVAEARANSQAALDRMQGAAARTASYFAAGTSLLQGAANYGYAKSLSAPGVPGDSSGGLVRWNGARVGGV
jgi:hypothetical protein